MLLRGIANKCYRYKPDVSLQFLTQELAFRADEEGSPEPDHDADARECYNFICRHGGEHLFEQKEELRFLSGKAGDLFQRAKTAAFGGVDIKGQI